MAQEIRPAASYQLGERIPMSWRVPAFLKQWLVDISEASGRSLGQEIELTLDRARVAERDLPYFGTLDLAIGASNTGAILLLGLILSDNDRSIWEAHKTPEHPDGRAVVAAALAMAIGIVFGVDISVARPGTISEGTWELRLGLMLEPVRQIRDFLVGDRPAPARFFDELIIDRLTAAQKQRIADMPLLWRGARPAPRS